MSLSCCLSTVGQQVAVLNLVTQGLKDSTIFRCHHLNTGWQFIIRGKENNNIKNTVVALHGFHKEVTYDPSSQVSKGQGGAICLSACIKKRRFRKLRPLHQKQKDELSMLYTTKSSEAPKNPTVIAEDLTTPLLSWEEAALHGRPPSLCQDLIWAHSVPWFLLVSSTPKLPFLTCLNNSYTFLNSHPSCQTFGCFMATWSQLSFCHLIFSSDRIKLPIELMFTQFLLLS